MIPNKSFKINQLGHLEIGGIDCVDLVKEFGTPLYVLDEQTIRDVCKKYVSALKEYPDSLICFASKALSTKAIYKIVQSENLGADVVSGGELYTAASAGFDMNKVYFHGNNKSYDELVLAFKLGVHCVVIDNYNDIELLTRISRENNNAKIKCMVRVNPGVEAHTHHYIQTSLPDSKFGFSMADGAAFEAVKTVIENQNLEFLGIHCHIGSQIFDYKPFIAAIDKMTDFAAKIYNELKTPVKELNMGGGFGIHYTLDDNPLPFEEYILGCIRALKEMIKTKNIPAPRLIFEPGRSIVGEAGVTLYTVGSIKEIKGLKKYVAIDGGMFDNPRYALYQAKYSCVLANRALDKPEEIVTIAGKCCESGDIIIEKARLPKAKTGDILAVFSTGAYNYSMASNYNRNPVPPMVLVNQGKAQYIVKPQTYEDLTARDAVPDWLK
ncbi:MAG TPA: diaminopimelate decarboxylase [Clostridia bacterium]